jgi:hypothetical protein
VAVKPAVVAPGATVTLAGTVMFVLLLNSPTVIPVTGAVPARVTAQLEVPGELTVTGEHETPLSVTAARLTVAFFALEPAVTVASRLLFTVPAVTVKVPLIAPWIVMDAGTDKRLVSLETVTDTGLVADFVSITTQAPLSCVPSVAGLQLRLDICPGVTCAKRFKVNEDDETPAVAVITAI